MKHQLLTISLLLTTVGFSQQKFTLQQAQQYALIHAYGMEIAELEIERAKQIYRQNLSYGLPQASASGQYLYNVELGALVTDFNGDGTLDQLVFGTDYQAQGGLVVNQLIFDGSYVVGLMAAKVLKDGASIGAEKTRSEMRRDVAKAYHLALLSAESVEILKANEGYLANLAEEMQKMNAAGLVSKADADQIMLNYNNMKNAVRYGEGQAQVAKMLLKLHMGFPVETPMQLADDLESLVVNASVESHLAGVSFDPTKTADYRSMANQVEGAKLQLLNKKLGYLPTIGVSYQNNIQYMSSEANIFGDAAVDIPSSLVSGSISVPLFTSGNGRAQVQEAKIQQHQVEIGLAQMEQALIMQHASTVNEYYRAIADYLSQKESAELAQTIRNQRRREYEEGVGSSTALTQSETHYQQALQSMFLAAQTVLDQQAELEYLMTQQSSK